MTERDTEGRVEKCRINSFVLDGHDPQVALSPPSILRIQLLA